MKVSKPVLYVGILGLLAYAAVTLTEPPSSAKRKTSVNWGNKRKTSTKEVQGFTSEDLEAKGRYSNSTDVPKNAFLPAIARVSGGSASASPDVIPADFTGGESSWVYTGTAEVDGVQTALVENRKTAEGEFLHVGQTWRTCSVVSIGGDVLTLRSNRGVVKTMRLNYESAPSSGNSGMANVPPVRPNLSGPIGGQISIRPEQSGLPGTNFGLGDAN